MIGVTGTNGKTTVCYIIEQLLGLIGERAKGPRSFWAAYIGVLPSAEEVGQSWLWSDDELALAQKAEVRWEKDREAKRCAGCSKPFGIFRSRHHCRKCGMVVCKECSPQQQYVQLELPFV